jgi:hypothetical protein
MIQDAVKDKFDAVRALRSEDILSALGLERRRSLLDTLLPVAGIFVAGMAIGTGVALLLAPKSGREMRGDIKDKANELTGRIGASAGEIVHEVRASLMHEADGATRAPGPVAAR